MFGLFKKKEPGPVKKDIVWISEKAKFDALIRAYEKDPSMVIICWFPETLGKLSACFPDSSPSVYLASSAHGSLLSGKKIVFAEHYPLAVHEDEFLTMHQLKEAETWTSLDEPVLRMFGGERISGLMHALGMDDNEAINHKLVTKSIRNAQDKLGKKVVMELAASSQEEWLKKNLPDR